MQTRFSGGGIPLNASQTKRATFNVLQPLLA